MVPEQQKPAPKPKKEAKKDLLKMEKPLFQLKRNEEGKVESIIAKLMEKKEKPQIGVIPRSPLLEQLDRFIPVLKQANTQLLQQEVRPELKFDARLEAVEDSSSSEDEEEREDEMIDESKEMQPEKVEMKQLDSVDEFQFNILTYPYLTPKDEASAETKNDEAKPAKVVEVENPLQQME